MRARAQEGWVRLCDFCQPPRETLQGLARLLRSLAADLELQVCKGALTQVL